MEATVRESLQNHISYLELPPEVTAYHRWGSSAAEQDRGCFKSPKKDPRKLNHCANDRYSNWHFQTDKSNMGYYHDSLARHASFIETHNPPQALTKGLTTIHLFQPSFVAWFCNQHPDKKHLILTPDMSPTIVTSKGPQGEKTKQPLKASGYPLGWILRLFLLPFLRRKSYINYITNGRKHQNRLFLLVIFCPQLPFGSWFQDGTYGWYIMYTFHSGVYGESRESHQRLIRNKMKPLQF